MLIHSINTTAFQLQKRAFNRCFRIRQLVRAIRILVGPRSNYSLLLGVRLSNQKS